MFYLEIWELWKIKLLFLGLLISQPTEMPGRQEPFFIVCLISPLYHAHGRKIMRLLKVTSNQQAMVSEINFFFEIELCRKGERATIFSFPVLLSSLPFFLCLPTSKIEIAFCAVPSCKSLNFIKKYIHESITA